MGGFGSGRRKTSSRGNVEGRPSIDLNRLHRLGYLGEGWEGKWSWQRDGETVGTILMRVEHEGLRLAYRVRVNCGDWEVVTQKIAIMRNRCRYGGERQYFECPGPAGSTCSRRVLKLYGTSQLFLCRHCCRLSYRSQSEDLAGRTRRRAIKCWRRLGAEDSSFVFKKPKGMWRSTFERLREQAIQAEMLADDEYERRAAQLEERIGR